MSDPQAVSENQRGEVLTTDYVRSISTGGGKPGAGYAAVMVPRSIAFRGRGEGMGDPELGEPDQVNSIRSVHGGASDMIFGEAMTVRRLTPLERERLMGWPDGWTEWGIDENGERVEMADTTRDRMTGNGVITPAAAWLAHRLLNAGATAPGDRSRPYPTNSSGKADER